MIPVLEVLKGRIISGLNYCNKCWRIAKSMAENNPEGYKRTMQPLDSGAKRLQGLISLAVAYGLNECVFGKCKWDEDKFICFGCTFKSIG